MEISTVKAVLPHLHDDFIATCLKEYGNAFEVISAVLEGHTKEQTQEQPKEHTNTYTHEYKTLQH